jgi:hypothetical protein
MNTLKNLTNLTVEESKNLWLNYDKILDEWKVIVNWETINTNNKIRDVVAKSWNAEIVKTELSDVIQWWYWVNDKENAELIWLTEYPWPKLWDKINWYKNNWEWKTEIIHSLYDKKNWKIVWNYWVTEDWMMLVTVFEKQVRESAELVDYIRAWIKYTFNQMWKENIYFNANKIESENFDKFEKSWMKKKVVNKDWKISYKFSMSKDEFNILNK